MSNNNLSISNFKAIEAMMRKLIKKIFILILPFLLLSSLPLIVGLYYGDLLLTSQIIALQEANDGLYDPSSLRENLINYKLQVALYTQADFLVLGSSRLHFLTGDAITNPDYTFYNAAVNGLMDKLKQIVAM
jgi:hypothetical protein